MKRFLILFAMLAFACNVEKKADNTYTVTTPDADKTKENAKQLGQEVKQEAKDLGAQAKEGAQQVGESDAAQRIKAGAIEAGRGIKQGAGEAAEAAGAKLQQVGKDAQTDVKKTPPPQPVPASATH
jgi:hypothetical protein